MFAKFSLSVLVCASLSCAGQVVTTGGYATTSGPVVTPVSAANAPLISTPDIALPGSGPAVGAPLAGNTNDSRVSTGPSVADHNGFGAMVTESAASGTAASVTSAQTPGTSSASNSATEPFEFGIQRFESGTPSTATAAQSLGDIARRYRGQHRQVRTYNNDSIAKLNTAGVQTGNLSAGTVAKNTSVAPAANETSSAPTPQSINALVAQNHPPALPQSDQEREPSQTRQQATPATASQQRHAAAAQNTPAVADAAAKDQSSGSSQQNGKSGKLPQTGSPLPLLLVIGALGVGGGTLYLIRR